MGETRLFAHAEKPPTRRCRYSHRTRQLAQPGSSRSALGLFKQQMRANIQPLRYSFNVINRDVPLASFDAAEIRPVHLNIVCEILLAEPTLLSAAANIGGHNFSQLSRVGTFHPSCVARKMLIRRRVLSINSPPMSYGGLQEGQGVMLA